MFALIQRALKGLIVSALTGLFGLIYEIFSHEVYSRYMQLAFLIPLFGVSFLSMVLALPSFKAMPGKIPLNLWDAGIAAFTVGSLFQGVLEIFGSTNRLIAVYPVTGSLFLLAGILSYAAGLLSRHRDFHKN